MGCSAYLDIETTGLDPVEGEMTVVGIYRDDGSGEGVVQLVGDDISADRLMEEVVSVDRLYTYNGARFDLPFIKAKLGIDITGHCDHKDLMFSCWKRKLFGGLKGVERKLGITRRLRDVDGLVAVQLWHEYIHYGDKGSLTKLLEYNQEDVLNLKVLREKLGI